MRILDLISPLANPITERIMLHWKIICGGIIVVILAVGYMLVKGIHG